MPIEIGFSSLSPDAICKVEMMVQGLRTQVENAEAMKKSAQASYDHYSSMSAKFNQAFQTSPQAAPYMREALAQIAEIASKLEC